MQIQVQMVKAYDTKHSVRFDAPDPNAAIKSVYIAKANVGGWTHITVSVEVTK